MSHSPGKFEDTSAVIVAASLYLESADGRYGNADGWVCVTHKKKKKGRRGGGGNAQHSVATISKRISGVCSDWTVLALKNYMHVNYQADLRCPPSFQQVLLAGRTALEDSQQLEAYSNVFDGATLVLGVVEQTSEDSVLAAALASSSIDCAATTTTAAEASKREEGFAGTLLVSTPSSSSSSSTTPAPTADKT